MRATAYFLCQLVSAIAIIGCANASDGDEIVIDGKVRLEAGDSYLFVAESMDREERETNIEIILEFANDFEEMFGVPPAPYTAVFYDAAEAHWHWDSMRFLQPSTSWSIGYASRLYFENTFKDLLAKMAQDNPEAFSNLQEENPDVNISEFVYTYEQFKPIIKHELTHFAFYNTFYSGEDVPLDWTTNAPYGAGPVPDAVDDGIADYLTTDKHRQYRRDVFKTQKESGFEFLPLAELFEVENVWFRRKTTEGDFQGAYTDIPGVTQEEIERNGVLIYNQGFVVFEFIMELGGMDFFRHMIAGFLADKNMDQILSDYDGKDGMPKTVAELDRLWWEDIEKP